MEDKTVNLQPAAARSGALKKVSPALLVVGLLVLAGCGGSSNSTSSSATTSSAPAETTPTTSTTSSTPATGAGEGQKLSLEANAEGQLQYNTTSLSAKAGAVSIDFTNAAPVGHNVTIESSSGETVGSTPTFQGGSKTVSVNLKPGTYKFFCSVPGHRQAGMEGTLTVK